MQLDRAISESLDGYFSTHRRSKKADAAYSSDLAQFLAFLGAEFDLVSLSGSLVERWLHTCGVRARQPASSRRKVVVLKVFCSYWVRKGTLPESS